MINKTKLYLFSTLLMVSIFFISLWTLDISVAAINTPNVVLIGLWGEVTEPWIKYHQALYMAIFSFFLTILSVLMLKNNLVGLT